MGEVLNEMSSSHEIEECIHSVVSEYWRWTQQYLEHVESSVPFELSDSDSE